MPAFRKGQSVTLLQNWDRRGTVRIVNLVVHSCGNRQMILVDGAGVKFQGMFFRPCEEQGEGSAVVLRLSREDAEAAAMARGSAIVERERVTMEGAIVHHGYAETHGYTVSMRAEIACLHEPRALFADGEG